MYTEKICLLKVSKLIELKICLFLFIDLELEEKTSMSCSFATGIMCQVSDIQDAWCVKRVTIIFIMQFFRSFFIYVVS